MARREVDLELQARDAPRRASPARRSRSRPSRGPWPGTSRRRRRAAARRPCRARRPRTRCRGCRSARRVRPATSSGSASASRIRSATVDRLALVGEVVDEHRELVAAQPRRGVAGCGCSRPGAARPPAARASPSAWPSVSLTFLKSSRSRKMTASGAPLRRRRASACSTRSRSSMRFGRPVSVSWLAWCSRRRSSALRSLTSRVFRTMPSTAPSPIEVRRQRLDVDPAAARVADAVLDVAGRALLEVGEEPLQAGLVIGVDELPPVHALRARLVQADEPQRRGADVEDDAVGVDDAHDVGGVAHERAEPRLEPVAEVGLGQRLVLADEVGDPQQHEQEDDAGRDADDHVARPVQDRLGDRHGRCDEARDGEHREARARQPRPAALGGHGEQPHRRVQRGAREQDAERAPGDGVRPGDAVAAVQRGPQEQEVAGDEAGDRPGEQQRGPALRGARPA